MQSPVENTQTGLLADHQQGSNDELSSAGAGSAFYGDAFGLLDRARGGNDLLGGGDDTSNVLFGDAQFMDDHSHGGDDTLIGGDNALNTLFGDAYEINDHARGGDDSLTGGVGAPFIDSTVP